MRDVTKREKRLRRSAPCFRRGKRLGIGFATCGGRLPRVRGGVHRDASGTERLESPLMSSRVPVSLIRGLKAELRGLERVQYVILAVLRQSHWFILC